MSSPFDELARTLATSMPRRRAVYVLGAALVTTSLTGFKPRPARAGTLALGRFSVERPCKTGQFCGFAVEGQDGYNIGCCMAKGVRFVCCNQDKEVGSWCCPEAHTCGDGTGKTGPSCVCSNKCKDGSCCPKSKGRCVSGTCCPLKRTTFAPGTKKNGVACCPPGTVAVPGATGACCPKGQLDCCEPPPVKGDGGDELANLSPALKRGQLCVNGKVRKA